MTLEPFGAKDVAENLLALKGLNVDNAQLVARAYLQVAARLAEVEQENERLCEVLNRVGLYEMAEAKS